VTGVFENNAEFGSQVLTGNTGYNVFVAKLDAEGNWQWTTDTEGTGNAYGNDISTDVSGNCYIAGGLNGTASFGVIPLTSIGNWDIITAKLDTNGNWLWVERAGGPAEDAGEGLSCDSNGNILLTGYFQNTADFGASNLTSNGVQDIFIARMDSDGNWLWVQQVGGTGNDQGDDTFVDNDNCYVNGFFSGIVTFGETTLTSAGNLDAFFVKLDTGGNWLWTEGIGGTGPDAGIGIISDSNDNMYVSGSFTGTIHFGNILLTSYGGLDIFVGKLGRIVETDDETAPDDNAVSCLHNACPNPVLSGETTNIKTYLADRESGTLSIYNLRGQLIQTRELSPGTHETGFDGKGLASGVYLYQLKTPSVEITKKLVLLR
jgi:hypothetical protein